LKLSGELAILELGENSAESCPNPKLAVAENEKWALQEKNGRTGFPELLPVGTGKPTSNCRRVTGTQGGRIGPASQKLGLRGALKLSTFLLCMGPSGSRSTTGKNQNCRSGMNGVSNFHVYEFDLQRSSGNA
jgi:hypothetical protein